MCVFFRCMYTSLYACMSGGGYECAVCMCSTVYMCIYVCIVVPYVARNKFAIVVSHYSPLKKKKKKKRSRILVSNLWLQHLRHWSVLSTLSKMSKTMPKNLDYDLKTGVTGISIS